MNVPSLLAAAGIMLLLGATDASAAARRGGHHPGHHARVNTAVYTTPLRPPSRVLRMTGSFAVRKPTEGTVRLAQAGHHHLLMRGS